MASRAGEMLDSGRKARRAFLPLFATRYSLFALLAFGTSAAAQTRPAAFVDAATLVPGLIVEMRYAGAHNFVGRPIDGYEAPHCLLTRPAASALAAVAADLKPQ